MNKICPYCGRLGSVGISCSGCGYVLRETDQNVQTSDPKASVSITPLDPAASAIQKTIKNPINSSEMLKTAAKSSLPHKATGKPAPRKSYPGALLGAAAVMYGVYGFFKTLSFYFKQDFLNGIVGNAIAIAMISGGLLIVQSSLHLNRSPRMKKSIKWVVIISLVVAFAIPLILLLLQQ